MVTDRQFWKGRRVFLTGHTGFKGGWLALWLADMGAEVYGYALLPPTNPDFFTVTGLYSKLADHTIDDVRNAEGLSAALHKAEPEIVFHLAAQPLVRYSYEAPAETYAVNVMGTVNLFEAIRKTGGVRSVVNVTTDKCYENREWVWPYRENDRLGGHDPYSSSKACSELVASAWRRSYFTASGTCLATARAGNVIGGGDWAADRLIPDFLRALDAGETLVIRSPRATRPWQHVLEPLSGYLLLAQSLYEQGASFAESWNFGPDESASKPVQWMVEYLCSRIDHAAWSCDQGAQLHEANILKLDSSMARRRLSWKPLRNLQEALDMTLAWHQAWKRGEDMYAFSLGQIRDYEASGGDA